MPSWNHHRFQFRPWQLECAGLYRDKLVMKLSYWSQVTPTLKYPAYSFLLGPTSVSGQHHPIWPHRNLPIYPSGYMAWRLLVSHSLPLESRLTLPVFKS